MTSSNSRQTFKLFVKLLSNPPVGGQAFKPLNYSTIEQQSLPPDPKIFSTSFAFIALNVNEKFANFTGNTRCYE